VIQNDMRIVLDEEEIVQACQEWLANHHHLSVEPAQAGVDVQHIGSPDKHQAHVIFDTDKDGLRAHPYR
jgi:hypothetical protein